MASRSPKGSNEKVVLTQKKDGSASIHVDGNLKGSVPSKRSRTAPTAAKATKSATSPQKEIKASEPSFSIATRVKIAGQNPGDPVSLFHLATDPNVEVQLALAGNLGPLPSSVIDSLVLSVKTGIRAAVASRADLTDGNVIVLYRVGTPDVLVALAKNTHIGDSVLGDLSTERPLEIRVAVAGNIATNVDTLDQLSFHKEVEVREAVASNPSTDPDTLLYLSDDQSRKVKLAVAGNRIL